MGNEFDFSELSQNLSKEIDEVIDAEESKAMEEAVDAVMKANENADEAMLDTAEETAGLLDVEEEIQSDDSENTEVQPEEEVNGEKEADSPAEEDIPELDFSDLDFDDLEDDDEDAENQLDNMFRDVDVALAEQVERHLGPSFAELLDEEEGDEPEMPKKETKKKDGILAAVPKWLKILITVLICIILIGAFLLFTRPGQRILTKAAAHFVISKTNTENPDDVHKIDEKDLGEGFIDPTKVTPIITEAVTNPGAEVTPIVDDNDDPVFEEDDTVINILLIGEENYYHDVRGRSDSMMVASLDKDGGPVKLVSFMRDLYVEIPGYSDNKLNAAYSLGGAPLLVETLEKNFGLKLDGYVIVQYDGFEAIIDKLGGLEISLTDEEAKYLNRTDYISKPEQRNVVAGNQKMTGSQVLGYCRVRKVNTANGLYADYGRTYRQRLVLNKIFDKYKTKNISELYNLMTECLKYVTVSEGIEDACAECLQIVVENKMFNLEQYRIPYEDKEGRHFTSTKIGGQEVLCPFPDNAVLLHDFLYGVKADE